MLIRIIFLFFILIYTNGQIILAQSQYTLSIYEILDEEFDLMSNQTFKTTYDRENEINKLYYTFYNNGYLAFSIDSNYTDSINKKVFFKKGLVYKWAYINTDVGNISMFEQAGVQFKNYAQKPVQLDVFKNDVDKLLRFLENNGFPFAYVYLDSIILNGDGLHAFLVVNKNNFIHIDKIKIEGTAVFSKAFLQNYLNLRNDNFYNEKKMAAIDEKLKKINFIKVNKQTEFLFSDSTCSIYVFADKKNANSFDGVLGVVPDELTGKIVLTGDVHIKLLNAFNRAEFLQLNWKRFKDNSQKLNFNFEYPYIFSLPIGFDYQIDLLRKDTTYVRIENVLGLKYFLNNFDYLRLFGSFNESYILTPPVHINVLPSFADFSTRLYGLELHSEQLNNRITPTKGYFITTALATGNKTIVPHPNLDVDLYKDVILKASQYKCDIKAAYFINLNKQNVLVTHFSTGYLSGNNLFNNEMYRLGGLKSLRGFDEDAIYASLFSMGVLEYRFMIEDNSFLAIFANAAYYENNNFINRIIDRPYGFGTGFNFETKQGVFSINYAVGKQFNNPLSFKNAKIHFGLISTF